MLQRNSPLRLLLQDTAGRVLSGIVLLLCLVAIFAPQITRSPDPNSISDIILKPPLHGTILGTDNLGRSVLVQLVYGLRVTLIVGLLSAAVATVVGILIGSVAGYFSVWLDTLLMRITEVFQVMPSFILAALTVALLGAGTGKIVGIIAILSWPDVARVMRSEVLRVKQLDYVDSARVIGTSEVTIMLREVIPNALGPAIPVGTLIIARAILLEASLSFLGLSSPTVASWGRMLNNGQQFLFQAWWLSVIPGLAIFLTVVLFNQLGNVIGRPFEARPSVGEQAESAESEVEPLVSSVG